MAKYPSQLQDKFNLRLPDGMKDAIADLASKSERSINSQIIVMLQKYLDDINGSTADHKDINSHKVFIELKSDLSEKPFDMCLDTKVISDAVKEAVYHVIFNKIIDGGKEMDEVKDALFLELQKKQLQNKNKNKNKNK